MSVRGDRRALDAVRRFGADAVAFLALESGMRHWFDAPPPEGTGACVAYWDTGTAWVAAGAPLTADAEVTALRAFAGGSLLRFGARTVLRHPAGAPWALAMLLCAWSAFLGLLAVTDHAAVLGFDRATLAGWVAFDVVLAFLLFRFARRPRAGGLLAATLLAAGDAAVSLAHLAGARAPAPSWHLAVRLLASAGPVAGAIALAWATLLRLRLRRSSGALPRHVAEVSG